MEKLPTGFLTMVWLGRGYCLAPGQLLIVSPVGVNGVLPAGSNAPLRSQVSKRGPLLSDVMGRVHLTA